MAGSLDERRQLQVVPGQCALRMWPRHRQGRQGIRDVGVEIWGLCRVPLPDCLTSWHAIFVHCDTAWEQGEETCSTDHGKNLVQTQTHNIVLCT